MPKWIVPILTPILCGLALLLGLIVLGRWTHAALRERGEYTVVFTDVECRPPGPLSRADFLAEVQYLAQQPDRLHLLDRDLPAALARAFAAHPWVESVRRVEIHPGQPGVRVDLVYREAVLAVAVSEGRGPASYRAVDRHGVLLPMAALHSRLPVLHAGVAAPAGPPGTAWGDPLVKEAAATADYLRPHQDRLRLEASDIEVVRGSLVFCKPGVRVLWGHAPGREESDEAPAAVKLRRLLQYQARNDGLGTLEHDVRLVAYDGHFPLAYSGKR